MSEPINPFIGVAVAICFAIAVLLFLKSFKRINPTIRSVGFYGLIVWYSSTILGLIVQYIYRFHFSTFYASKDLHIQQFENNDWKFDRTMDLIDSFFLSGPKFAVFCIILFYLTKTSFRLKSILSVVVMFLTCRFLLKVPESPYYPLSEMLLYYAIYYCGTLLLCIWFFKIKIKDFDFSPQIPDDILEA